MTTLPPDVMQQVREIELELEDLEAQTRKRITLMRSRLSLLLGEGQKERKVKPLASPTGRRSQYQAKK